VPQLRLTQEGPDLRLGLPKVQSVVIQNLDKDDFASDHVLFAPNGMPFTSRTYDGSGNHSGTFASTTGVFSGSAGMFSGGAGNDNPQGHNGHDIITGDSGDDQLEGESNTASSFGGNDILFGRQGDDLIFGGGGHDYLRGGTGNDKISGGAGDDVLVFEEGNDWLQGDGGADRFVMPARPGTWFVSNINDMSIVIDFDLNSGDVLDFRADKNLTRMEDIGTKFNFIMGGAYSAFVDDVLLYKINANHLEERHFLFNSAPEAADDLFTTVEDQTLTLSLADLLTNDSDADGDVLSLAALLSDGGTGGDWSVEGDVIHFTPDADFHGQAEVRYQISDGGAPVEAVLRVDVIPANDAPTLVTAPVLPEAQEDQPWQVSLSDGIFQDVDGDPISLTVTAMDGSPLPAWLSFDAHTGQLSGTPSQGDVGVLALQLTGTDPEGLSAATNLFLTIAEQNDAPITAEDVVSTVRDTPLLIAAATLLANDEDPEGLELTLTAITAEVGGTASLDENGDILFTPEAGYDGEALLTYTVTDSGGASATETVRIEVGPRRVLEGTSGADVLIADGDTQIIRGQEGDDVIIADNDEDIVIDAGAGNDEITGGANGSQTVRLDGDAERYRLHHDGDWLTVEDSYSLEGTDRLRDIDRLVFGDGTVLEVDSFRNQIVGSGNGETLTGTGWQDDIQGQAGDDVLVASAG